MKERNLRIQLERHERSQQQLLTNLSHDVRTPLTSLKGYVSLLQDTDNKNDADRYITLISNRMDRLTQLLDQLFTYNKLTDDHYSLATQTVNLSENLLTCLLNFYHQFQELDCKPNLSLPDQPVFIEANPDLIQRIFDNLIKNALTHGHPPINISISPTAIIQVSNQMTDLTHQEVNQVFDRFYQGQSHRSSNSSGLGLSIVKSAVEKLGGGIEAQVSNQQFILTIDFSQQIIAKNHA